MATRNVRRRLNNGPTNTQRGPMITSLRQAIGNGPRAPGRAPGRMQATARLRQTLALPPAQRMARQMRRLAGMSQG